MGFSCCIIGHGKLTIECAEQLLGGGHQIRVLQTDNEMVKAWAARQDLRCITTRDDAQAAFSEQSFDYLLSIINPNKTPPDLINLATKGAINFHDGPLPRYAGLHVTTWAILNRENAFGVSWHKMAEAFDAGALLKQTPVVIEKSDTAFTLNAKCFAAGKALFVELIDELDHGKVQPVAQNLEQRSVFLSSKRPDCAGILDWQQSAEYLSALVRGLNFSPDANPLGFAKLTVNSEFYAVLDASVVESDSSGKAGSIIAVHASAIDVVTGSGVVRLKELANLNGEPVDIAVLAQQQGLEVGYQLPELDAELKQATHDWDHAQGKRERFWLQKLTTLKPHSIANTLDQSFDQPADYCWLDQMASPEILAFCKAEYSETGLHDVMLALFCCFLYKMSEAESFDLSLTHFSSQPLKKIPDGLYTLCVPFNVEVDEENTVRQVVNKLLADLDQVNQSGRFSRDLIARTPALEDFKLPISVEVLESDEKRSVALEAALHCSFYKNSGEYRIGINRQLITGYQHEDIAARFQYFIKEFIQQSQLPFYNLSLVDEAERNKLLEGWNNTEKHYPRDICVHELFEQRSLLQPDTDALIFRDKSLTYEVLNRQATAVAAMLQRIGAGPDKPVGLYVERSLDMVVGLLGILKSGAAYVPLDPAYPQERIALMVEDAQLNIIVTQTKLQHHLPSDTAELFCVDQVVETFDPDKEIVELRRDVEPHNLAYVIYTSGSTGKPKGVMVEHRNVINFFSGMDDTLEYSGNPGVWLAVTSISFDISVLEIFWSLARGFKVIIQEEETPTIEQLSGSTVNRAMDVGLFYFSSDAGASENNNRYRLLLEGAKFADKNGFASVWTPERHFHLFGGLYPNPSVTSAAIAAVTDQIAIRAGSIVLPLHNPIRIAEEWSVVDNLSNGRVGFSFASGWHANDFSLMPDNYENRKQIMYDGIEQIRRLWAGDTIDMTNGEGAPFSARIYPPPLQKSPPIWVTTAGNVDSFKQAGVGGFNILTNLLGQSISDIKEKIAAYRIARAEAGHAGDGIVSVMVHTFVGENVEQVRELVREPFCNYLKTSFDLVKIAPWAFPAFKQPSKQAAQDPSFDASALTDEDLDALLDHAFERYFETAGVFGTAESCIPLIDEIKTAGVDEIACLIDFGVDEQIVLDNLPNLAKLKKNANNIVAATKSHAGGSNFTIADQIARHKVTHFQCTPSMARILAAEPDNLAALGSVQKMLLGGEALPVDLAKTLQSVLKGQLINVYGPTETTIWSTFTEVNEERSAISIGRPIANTKIYILDKKQQLLPIGVAGELYIGGEGVVRGYLGRSKLTAERFIVNPFDQANKERIYRTGDLVRYNTSGDIEFLGRLDHQVKLRGYRIELGEIETQLCTNAAVADSVVTTVSEGAAQSLVAYIVPTTQTQNDLNGENDVENAAVNAWGKIWDETYQHGTQSAEKNTVSNFPEFDTSGWLNSFSGEQHDAHHMQEWLDATVNRIKSLKPKRVLEIGCGTGMLLYRLAPECERYVGVDLSANAIEGIQQEVQKIGLDNVRVLQASADSIALDDELPFDVVIVNSVIQYFPSVKYLIDRVQQISELTADKAAIFIGDVRNLNLLDAFSSDVEIARTPQTISAGEISKRIEERVKNEPELVISPDFFYQLADALSDQWNVDVQLKRGRYLNEMTAFRYDVVFHKGGCNNILTDIDFEQLPTVQTLDLLQTYVDQQKDRFVVRDIVNARLEKTLQTLDAVLHADTSTNIDAVLSSLGAHKPAGVDPEVVYQLSSSPVHLVWSSSGNNATFDAYFMSPDDSGAQLQLSPVVEQRSLNTYANQPSRHLDSVQLIAQLKAELADKLPAFMVPDQFVVLNSLPLTPNGKIDRKALPEPAPRSRPEAAVYVAPASDLDEKIAAVFRDMLNLEQIGIKDNFFDVGANSLLIVQAHNRLCKVLDRTLSLVSLYRYPTIETLAQSLSGESDGSERSKKGQQRGEKRRAAQSSRARRKAAKDKR